MLSKDIEVWQWVKDKFSTCAAFIAGYVDAEGNFILNQRRARFKVDSYDFDVLTWMNDWLKKQEILPKFRQIYNQGDLQGKTKFIYRKDLWRLNINEANSLLRFIHVINPYMLHLTRKRQVNLCIRNISIRKKHGSIK